MRPPDTAVIRLGGHQLGLRREQLLFGDEHDEHDVRAGQCLLLNAAERDLGAPPP